MSQENYDKLADVMGVPHMDATKLGYINHIPVSYTHLDVDKRQGGAQTKVLHFIGNNCRVVKEMCISDRDIIQWNYVISTRTEDN